MVAVEAAGEGGSEGVALQELSDEELQRELLDADHRATARQSRFARAMVDEGVTVLEAARRAGISARNVNAYKAATRPAVVRLVALLREQGRRRASLTVMQQIQRFQHLARKAEAAGELAAAISAEVHATKLAGLFPKDSQQLVLGGGMPQIFVVTGLPPRDAPPLLPAAVDVEVVEVAPKVKCTVEELADVLC